MVPSHGRREVSQATGLVLVGGAGLPQRRGPQLPAAPGDLELPREAAAAELHLFGASWSQKFGEKTWGEMKL